MPTAQEILEDLNSVLKEHGTLCRFRYFTGSVALADYDSAQVLSRSGVDVWTSGLPQPLSTKNSSYDAGLVEQGRLLADDTRLYFPGTISTSGIWRVGIGSPIRAEYAPIEGGATGWVVNGSVVLKKAYVRVLPGGSLYGEA